LGFNCDDEAYLSSDEAQERKKTSQVRDERHEGRTSAK
jgi:hypothetical protein